MDEDVRELVRAWAASRSVEDGVRAARARQRAGLLPEEHGRLAATLGDPVALALGFASLDVDWPQPAVSLALERGAREALRVALADAQARTLQEQDADVARELAELAAAGYPTGAAPALTRLLAAAQRRVVRGWTGGAEDAERAVQAVWRRDARWLERRLGMILLFGPELLPPVEPWTPPSPPPPARPRLLMGPPGP